MSSSGRGGPASNILGRLGAFLACQVLLDLRSGNASHTWPDRQHLDSRHQFARLRSPEGLGPREPEHLTGLGDRNRQCAERQPGGVVLVVLLPVVVVRRVEMAQ